MGEFLSVILTNYLNVKVSISFVPQFSVNRKIIPDERRWDKYVDNIKEWKFVSLENYFNNFTQYYIFSCDTKVEERHWGKIPFKKNICKVIFENTDHSLSLILKEKNILYNIISLCFNKDNPTQLIEKFFEIKKLK